MLYSANNLNANYGQAVNALGLSATGGSISNVLAGGPVTLFGSSVLESGGSIQASRISVFGDLTLKGAAGGPLTVENGGRLEGGGSIGGALIIAGGGTLSPGESPGTLTLGGALTLAETSTLVWDLRAGDITVGGGVNDLVTGITHLTLDGVLQVNGAGDFSTAVVDTAWRLFNYTGVLDDQGLEIDGSSLPVLADGLGWSIDTSQSGQVNLVVTAVPEPSAACIGLLLLIPAAGRRRRHAKA